MYYISIGVALVPPTIRIQVLKTPLGKLSLLKKRGLRNRRLEMKEKLADLFFL